MKYFNARNKTIPILEDNIEAFPNKPRVEKIYVNMT